MFYEYVRFKTTGYLGRVVAINYSGCAIFPTLTIQIDGIADYIEADLYQVECLTREQYLEEKEKQEAMMRPTTMNMTLTGTTLTFSCGNHFDPSTIKDVIFNNPATIILWKDGTKTVVKCQEGDTFNPELGFLAAVFKKLCGNKGNFNDVVKKWVYPNDQRRN